MEFFVRYLARTTHTQSTAKSFRNKNASKHTVEAKVVCAHENLRHFTKSFGNTASNGDRAVDEKSEI